MIAETIKHAEILVKPESRVACTLDDSKGTGRVKRRCDNQASYEINRAHVDGIVDVRMSGQLDAAYVC